MQNLLGFHNQYTQLKDVFEQAVAEATSKITLTKILRHIDPNPTRNPRRPRFDCSGELEKFQEGDAIELGVLYLTPHNCPSYVLTLTINKAELSHVGGYQPIKTFSDTPTIFRLYSRWLREINQAKAKIPPPPF